jgi:hypothetical protein
VPPFDIKSQFFLNNDQHSRKINRRKMYFDGIDAPREDPPSKNAIKLQKDVPYSKFLTTSI